MIYILNLFNVIGNHYHEWKSVYDIIGSILGFMFLYKNAYYIIGLFFTRKFKPAKNKHKYAILIAARNEKNVLCSLSNLS